MKLDWFCWLVIALAVFYFGAWIIARWWPNIRAALVAINGF